ncbi:hypothetical protein, partial [Escherichia marmotae]|uniref:hypothetical protein n=1 Tax=Escherichia marmotae TaxID=1499973 RepID=UPI003A5C6278
ADDVQRLQRRQPVKLAAQPARRQPESATGRTPTQSDSVTGRDYICNADGEVSGINDKLRGCLVFSYDRSGWLTGR